MQDVRYGLRTLGRSPGFTIVALLTLALGIGANTAIFSFVNGVLLNPLPYAHADRIVRVLEKPPLGARNGISTLTYLDWQKQNTVFEYMCAWTQRSATTLTGFGEPVDLRAAAVGAHYFDIFGVHAVLGRTFAADEDQRGKEHVVVLSHAIWESQFGGDPKLIGKTVRLDGEPYEVIGVLPAGGSFDRLFAQLYTPLVFKPENMTRNFHWFGAFAKLKPGMTLEAARKQMDTIGARIAHDYPDSNKGWGVIVERYSDILVEEDLRKSLYVLMAAVGMLLLISCANIANLMLVRRASREREIAIRAALGGDRARIIRQFLTESVLLSLGGGVLGVALGYAGMRALKAAIPPFTLPAEADVRLDVRVLIFTFVLSVLTGILFGLVPAIATARSNLAGILKDRARTASGSMRGTLRGALVVIQVAVAFVLLTGAGLLIRSFSRMLDADMGFDSTNVMTAGLPIAYDSYPKPGQLNQYLRAIVGNLSAVPGVQDAAFTSALPLQGGGYTVPFQIAGQPIVARANRQVCFFKMITPSYFRVMGMKVRRGRSLNDHDVAGAPMVTVINETMAKKFFASQDPIGKRILIQQIIPAKTQLGPEIEWEVVGVVGDERITNLDDTRDRPGVYVTNEQSPVYFGGLVMRASMNPEFLEKAIRNAVYNVNKEQPLTDVKTLDQLKSESMADDRLRSILLGVFAAIALALSAVGIYGVVSYTVAQRTNEMGIRAALGATSGSLVRLALRGGMWMMLAGLMLGFAGALAFARLVATLLFGVGAWDAATITGVAVLLAGVGLTACLIPARRAARVDPMVALRYE